jgi:hypothetical protein
VIKQLKPRYLPTSISTLSVATAPHFTHLRLFAPIHIKMTGRGGGGGRRVLVPPINFIFKLLQSVSFYRSFCTPSIAETLDRRWTSKTQYYP